MYICLHDHDYVMDFFLFYFMVLLRSTTSPYGRPMIEVVYRETLFHSTKAVGEMIAREEWLGCRHDVAHVRHTPVNTNVGSMYTIFGFSYYKNLYVLCFQKYIYIVLNKNTGGL